jgi:hypothetical protein
LLTGEEFLFFRVAERLWLRLTSLALNWLGITGRTTG